MVLEGGSLMDQVRPDLREMRSTGSMDQIHPDYPDSEKKNFQWRLMGHVLDHMLDHVLDHMLDHIIIDLVTTALHCFSYYDSFSVTTR